jgi:hypothetical protein
VSDALVMQHAEQMHPITLSSVACLVLPYFSTLLYEQQDFSKKKLIEHKMCFDFLYNYCLQHLSFYEYGEILQMYFGIHGKYTLF